MRKFDRHLEHDTSLDQHGNTMHFEGTVIHVQKLGRKTLVHKKDEMQTCSQPGIPKIFLYRQ